MFGEIEYKLLIQDYMTKDEYKQLIQKYMDKFNISYTRAVQYIYFKQRNRFNKDNDIKYDETFIKTVNDIIENDIIENGFNISLV